MAMHSIFGADAPPGSFAVYNDAGGVISLGNVFYAANGTTGWTCRGAKLWVPAGVTLPVAQVTIEARYQTTDTAHNLDTPALRQATASTAITGPAWLSVTWLPFAIDAGQNVLISYSFANSSYLYGASADGGFISASDGSPIVMSEQVNAQKRSYYRVDLQQPAAGMNQPLYGVDIIADDGTTPLPLAEYGFNEISGTSASDTSGNGHNLTVLSPANFDVSREGNGLHQVGDGYSYLIANATPWMETPSRTLMFWGRRGTDGAGGASRTAYQADSSGNTVFGISLSDGVNASFAVRAGGVPITLTTTRQSLGDWHHYALSYDQQYVRAYLDGNLVGEQAVTDVFDASDGNLNFYGEEYQQQVIDDLRIFDVAVSTADINYYMNTTIVALDRVAPSAPANLVATVDYQQVTLNWDASTDDTGVQNYIVYRGTSSSFTPTPANQVGGPATNTYFETAPVGTYYYKVAARDEAGNESATSAAVQAVAAMDPASDYLYPSALGWSVGATYNEFVTAGFSVGTLFGLQGAARIKGLRFYAPVPTTGCAIRLFEAGVERVVKTGIDLVTGWNTLLFDTAFIGISNTEYVVSIFQPGTTVPYTAVAGKFTTTRTQIGPAYSQTDIAGRYVNGSGYPVNFSDTWYGVDVVVDSHPGTLDYGYGTTILEENAKPGAGSSEWSIGGAGDSTNLGFARQFSVNVGETVDFSCHGDGTVIDVYRIGYYGTKGWRQVTSLTNTATSQPDPDIIPNSNGAVTCANWSTTASWTVPADALSGLFVGVYRNATLNNASYIPFCVRDDARPVDLIVKLSETTWALSYNYYGTPASPYTGKSVYGSGGPLGNITTRAHAATYHRPIVTREGIPQTYWLNCEAPLIRYIESNGLNVKYVASKDVDTGTAVLAGSKMIVSSGHDEYWSQGMRDTIEAYRDAGGHVVFMSGNEVFWRTRFSLDRDTMWVYKDTMDGPGGHVGGTPLDPVSWTGTWKDTRWAGRKPENTLTGTDFRMNGVNDKTATLSASADFAAHPMWRGTSLQSGTDVSVQGLIGFEADELAPTQPSASTAVLAQSVVNIDGSRADDNGQAYNGNGSLNWGVVSQRYASGAVVVGFGTCQWAWGLDEVHDRGGNYAATPLQQATLNLFADLGAQVVQPRVNLTVPTAVASLDVYGLIPAVSRSGKVKVWDGASWQAHPLKVWDGTDWTIRPVSGYDGAQFKIGKD
jgi:hypothetical protein